MIQKKNNNSGLVEKMVTRILTWSNGIYLFASLMLALLSLLLILVSVKEIYTAIAGDAATLSVTILDAIGLIVISIAIFDVGKYFVEEEVSRNKELRSPKEARKTLTKFIVIVFIAMSLESLVYTFIASKENISLLIYPALLLISAVFLLIGLGIYQKLSIGVEGKELQQATVSATPKK